MSDTNAKLGNATLEDLATLEESSSSAVGTEAEDASFGSVLAGVLDFGLQYERCEVPSSVSICAVTAIKRISLPGG
jgi:hypothetical protein